MTMTEPDTWFSNETATFGDRLTAAREAAGLAPDELARRLGVRARTLAQWEADAAEPRANRLQMLAGMLNVSLMWLLTGIGDGLDPPAEHGTGDADRQARALAAVLADLGRARAEAEALSGRIGRIESALRAAARQPSAASEGGAG